ncbi:uncharacterized protein LOC119104793 [Pollicipes pollicipes]|uniref:uncharacterized protein LOC119104793 n=1 Tax=Pollicipes pollicipes TaxID=41117 RepID=UPI001884A1C3|nr:uncharacterized protein LOC119104793 [Pollicipes pollicipes]
MSAQLEDVDQSLAKLEAVAIQLDAYSKQLESRFRAVSGRCHGKASGSPCRRPDDTSTPELTDSPRRGASNISTSTSSFEAGVQHDPNLNRLAINMFTKTEQYLQGELDSVTGEYQLLTEMNRRTHAKYEEMKACGPGDSFRYRATQHQVYRARAIPQVSRKTLAGLEDAQGSWRTPPGLRTLRGVGECYRD